MSKSIFNFGLLLLIILLFPLLPCKGSSPYPLLPYPQKIIYTHKRLVLENISLKGTQACREWEEWLQSIRATSSSGQTGKTLQITLTGNLNEIPVNPDEGYKLDITEKGIQVTATSPTGVYRALQTVRQLAHEDN